MADHDVHLVNENSDDKVISVPVTVELIPHQEVVVDGVEIPVDVTEPTKSDVTTPEVVRFDNLYCSTCRTRLSDGELMKTPIDYKINTDGSSSATTERYSLFCGKCQKFLGIYDPQAQKELADMTKNRLEKENAKE